LSAAALVVALTGAQSPQVARYQPARPQGSATVSLPRNETLYTTGTATSPPSNFNPLDLSGAYTGTQGLLYEPLFLYDPVHGRFIPWLATSGNWEGPTTYKLQVRGGVDWTASPSGAVKGALSGADVAYTVKLALGDKDDPYNADVASVTSATAVGNTVTVKFREPVGYAQWQDFLWHSPVLPQATWSALPPAARTAGANNVPVSTGPMLLRSTSSTEACYQDNPHWWGKGELGLSFKFQYLCDTVSGSSGAGLSALLESRTDWSNALLEGVTNLAGGKTASYDIKTYYPTVPYMLPAGTAWLQMDTAKAPMSNTDFRRAVAYAIDTSKVISAAYAGTVKVANPTGLLPYLSTYISSSTVKKYGFYYSQSLAKKFLEQSGYRGQHLTLEVPKGGTDWISAAGTICKQLAEVGIQVSEKVVPPETRDADIVDGNYDMVIFNAGGVAPTPWAYFDNVYQLPLSPGQFLRADTERFVDPAAWALVQRAAATPVTDTAVLRPIYAELETDFLQDLPEVPLWYSGAWFQATTTYWADYPSNTVPRDQFTPMMGPGWLGSTTTVYALAQLQPVKKAR
jgi:peptide/nickel transport system substrate-binding protein